MRRVFNDILRRIFKRQTTNNEQRTTKQCNNMKNNDKQKQQPFIKPYLSYLSNGVLKFRDVFENIFDLHDDVNYDVFETLDPALMGVSNDERFNNTIETLRRIAKSHVAMNDIRADVVATRLFNDVAMKRDDIDNVRDVLSRLISMCDNVIDKFDEYRDDLLVSICAPMTPTTMNDVDESFRLFVIDYLIAIVKRLDKAFVDIEMTMLPSMIDAIDDECQCDCCNNSKCACDANKNDNDVLLSKLNEMKNAFDALQRDFDKMFNDNTNYKNHQ